MDLLLLIFIALWFFGAFNHAVLSVILIVLCVAAACFWSYTTVWPRLKR
jgi:hypothetical protein